MTTWHRYLALEGASRATGKALTGAANLIFLFIVLSGMYLWLPRVWTWIQFKNVMWFRRGLAPKARDFNWHNVIGIWSARSAGDRRRRRGADFVSVGEQSRLPNRRGYATATGGRRGSTRRAPRAAGFCERPALTPRGLPRSKRIPAWRTMTTRFATSPDAPVVVTVDEGYGGQPQMRTTLTFDRASGAVARRETFESLSAGRRLRSWLRFAHTGEIYGLTGQTVAGLASAGGAVLVYTGVALALRRFMSWLSRRRADSTLARPKAA